VVEVVLVKYNMVEMGRTCKKKKKKGRKNVSAG
jgi:hypothetical protein